MTTPDEKQGVPLNGTCPAHSFLVSTVEKLVGRVDEGFRDLRGDIRAGFETQNAHVKSRCDGIEESIKIVRVETNDRITGHRDRTAADVNRLHDRIDDHIEKQHARNSGKNLLAVQTKPDSEPRLPSGIERTNKWLEFVSRLGVVAAGGLAVLYLLYRMAEAGLFK
jgi:hypothetical protein